MAIGYQITPKTRSKLTQIEEIRRNITSHPLSPQSENTLRWDSHLSHISGWAKLANQPLSKEKVLDILARLHSRNTSDLETKVLNYKKALNHVREFWTANPSPVSYQNILDLAKILGVQPGPRPEVVSLLELLQTGDIHPVIQAATVQLSFYPSRLAHLTSLLFLTRAGFDIHGWLSLEDYWSQNKDEYLKVIQQANDSADATVWLEFFCDALLTQLSELNESILSNSSKIDQKITKHLSLRQKSILNHLDQPNTSITNRQVQAMYQVSQITASRDLAKLAVSGLLAPHGSGRSTSYTKI